MQFLWLLITNNKDSYVHSFNPLAEQYERRKQAWIWIIRAKKYVEIDRETGSDEIFAFLHEVDNDLEDDIDNLMNDSDTEFVLEESSENELDFDDEPLNLLVPEANHYVLENPTIEKYFRRS